MHCVFLFYEVSRIEVCYKNHHESKTTSHNKHNKRIKEGLDNGIQRLSHCNPLPSQNHTKEKLLSRVPRCSLGHDYTQRGFREKTVFLFVTTILSPLTP